MFSKLTIRRQILEAFLDEELSPPEMQNVAELIEQEESVRLLFEDVQFHRILTKEALHDKIEAETSRIDWDAFSQTLYHKLDQESVAWASSPMESSSRSSSMSELQSRVLTVVPGQSATSEASSSPSWGGVSVFLSSFWTWVRQHPGMAMAYGATMGILVVLLIPFLDPGPKSDPDTVVQKIANIETAQVAVLQAKNNSTGKNMTVIVIDEPTQDISPTSPLPATKQQPKDKP